MNKYLVIAACIVSSNAIAASNNTIRFQGEVADETCSVTINGNTALPVVLLPTVSKKDLASSGSTAGETPFTIAVSGCTGSTTTDTNINTIFVANNITSSNRVGNTGTATNVSLELIEPTGSKAALDVTGTKSNAGLVLKQNEKSATHDYAVRYYAEGQAEAGTVLGSVQYSISYN